MIKTLEIITLKFHDKLNEFTDYLNFSNLIDTLLLNGITKPTIDYLACNL